MSFAGLSFVASALIAVATSVLMARIFGIEVVGQNALALVPHGVLCLLSTVREQPAVIRRLTPLSPRSPTVSGVFYAVYSFSVLLTAVMTIVVGIGTIVAFNGSFDHPDLVVPALCYLVANLIIGNTSGNLDVIFSAFGDGQSLFKVRLSESLSFALLLVLAAQVTDTVWGPVCATIVSWFVALTYRVVLVGRWLDPRVASDAYRQGLRELPEFIKFGLKLLPGLLAEGASNQAGTWALGYASSTSAVGAYSRATGLSYRLNEASWRLSEMLLPGLVHSTAQDDFTQRDRRYALGLRGSFTLLIAASAVLSGGAAGVMALFGDGFAEAATALAILCVVPAMRAITTSQADVLIAAHEPGLVSRKSVCGFVVVAAVTWPLTQAFGTTGAAASLLMGFGANAALGTWAMWSTVGVRARNHWPWPQRMSTVAAFLAAASAGATAASHVPALWKLPVGASLSALVFAIGLLLFRAVPVSEIRRGLKLIRREQGPPRA
ncbi:MAG: polysaccharide biosynthesis C-terminal domain-containing protein [Patulibacter sp.]